MRNCKLFRNVFILFLVLIGTINILLAAENQYLPSGLRSVLVKAQEAIDKKSYKRAEELVTKYLNKSRKPHHLAYYVLGNACYLDGRPLDAYSAYRYAYKLNPSYRPVCINLAKVCYDLKKFKEAGNLFLHAYDISEKPDPELLYEAGAAYYQGKLYGKAKAVLERLIKENQNIKEAWLKLFVFTCLELKEWNTAEHYLLCFLKKHKTKSTYWKLLAQVRLQRNDYSGAAVALEVAYRLAPPSSWKWKELADIYLYIGVPLKAARCLEKAYGKNPSPGQLDKIAKTYAEAHRVEKAVLYYTKALSRKPSASRWLEIAKLYYRNGMWKEATRALEESLKLDSRNGLAHLLLGYSSWNLGNETLALKELHAASKYEKYRDQALAALEVIKETMEKNDNRS